MKEIDGVVDITETDNYDEYEGQGGGGGSSELSELTDVDISNPADGQTLVYNAATEKWENGADGVLVLAGTLSDETFTLDHTGQQIKDAFMRGIVLLHKDNMEQDNELVCYTLTHIYDLDDLNQWLFIFTSPNGSWEFYAPTLNDYPSDVQPQLTV